MGGGGGGRSIITVLILFTSCRVVGVGGRSIITVLIFYYVVELGWGVGGCFYNHYSIFDIVPDGGWVGVGRGGLSSVF